MRRKCVVKLEIVFRQTMQDIPDKQLGKHKTPFQTTQTTVVLNRVSPAQSMDPLWILKYSGTLKIKQVTYTKQQYAGVLQKYFFAVGQSYRLLD